ncbi:MAG: DUF4198 domain-containing protein [Gemmatimonadales bacterium]|nr:DUF4198 domain-containing protein [Gemmatimonadales bacterium]
MRHRIFSLLAGLMLVLPAFATGHELWFESADEGLVLWRGHGHEAAGHDSAQHGSSKGDSPEHGDTNAPCPVEEFLQATVLESGGSLRIISPGEIFPSIWPSDAQALAVTVSSGIWTKTPLGTINKPRNRVESPLTSWRSIEGLKLIRSWDPALALPMGNYLEITPLDNLLNMKIGAKLKVLVSRHGEPVVGAVVTYDGNPRGMTGPDGRINIRLKSNGRQTIGASLTIPLPDEEIDEIISTARMEFFLE